MCAHGFVNGHVSRCRHAGVQEEYLRGGVCENVCNLLYKIAKKFLCYLFVFMYILEIF